jgi:hypothetical protein
MMQYCEVIGLCVWMALAQSGSLVPATNQYRTLERPPSGASAALPVRVPLDGPGGDVLVESEFGLCARATDVGIALPRPGSRYSIGTVVLLYPNDTDCRVRFSSIPSGEYRVFLRNDVGILGVADVVVVAHREQKVFVDSPAASIQGQIFRAGRPWPGATLEMLLPGGVVIARGTSDSAGRYVVLLNSDGEYRLRAFGRRNPVASWETALTVLPGFQHRDVAFGGGRLDVAIYGAITGPRVHVVLSFDDVRGSVLRRSLATEGDGVTRGTLALPFGRYRIGALQDLRASRESVVTLTPGSPVVAVDLSLGGNPSVMIVQDQDGVVVRNAVATSRGRMLLKDGDGGFSLSGVLLGAPVTIQASGFVPTCRLSDFVGVMPVVLEKGAPAEFRFPQGAATTPLGSVSGLTEASCPVSLQAFGYVRIPPFEEQGARFRILNLPAKGRLTWRFGQDEATIVLPTANLIVLPRKEVVK